MSMPPDTSAAFVVDPAGPKARPPKPVETDPRRLETRQKQISFGKNTIGYSLYRKAVPRRTSGPHVTPSPAPEHEHLPHPMTPDIYQICSKRSFDGQVKRWRRDLHKWDPAVGEDEEVIEVEQEYVTPSKGGRRSDGWLASPLKSGKPGKAAEQEDAEGKEKDEAAENGPSTFISPNKRSRIITPAAKASQAAGAQKRQRKGPSWADEPLNDEASLAPKTIFDDWDDCVKV